MSYYQHGGGCLEPAERVKQRADALMALSASQMKHLVVFARLKARNTGESDEDLLHSAHVRWLQSDVPVEGPDRTFEFLRGAISSIRSNTFRHQKLVRKMEGVRAVQNSPEEQDPLELSIDPASSQEDTVFAQQLYDLCARDKEVQMLVMFDVEQTSRADILSEMGWDDKKYDAVRKRKARLIARLLIDGDLS